MYNTDSDILRFSIQRSTTNLFKHFLSIQQRQKEEHDEAMALLRQNLPEQYKKYVDLVDSYTDAKAAAIRKEILDAGNDALRNMKSELDNFDYFLKNNNIRE